MSILIKYTKQAIILIIFIVITGCGIYKKVDARKVPPNVNDRAQKIFKKEEVLDYLIQINRKVVEIFNLQALMHYGEPH